MKNLSINLNNMTTEEQTSANAVVALLTAAATGDKSTESMRFYQKLIDTAAIGRLQHDPKIASVIWDKFCDIFNVDIINVMY